MFWDTPREQFEEEIRSLLNDEKIKSPLLLLDNKVDLIQKEEIEDSLLSKQVVEFCAKSAAIIHEHVSAKSGERITHSFEKLFDLILDLHIENFKLKEKNLLKRQQFINDNKKKVPKNPPKNDEIILSLPVESPSIDDKCIDEKQPPTKIEQGNLIFDLNDEYKTATITGIKPLSEVFIPRSINYKLHEYLITKFEPEISPNFYKIKSIRFANDSAIQELKEKFSNYILEFFQRYSYFCRIKKNSISNINIS